MPFPELSPLFSVYPLFPMALMNAPIRMDIKFNGVAMSDVGTEFSDFLLKIGTYQNVKLIDMIR